MHKVLLIRYDSSYDDDLNKVIREAAPAFEEVSDEDYQLLKQNLYKLKVPYGQSYGIIEDAGPVEVYINKIKDALEKIKADAAKANADALKAKMKREADKEKRAKAQYEKLKQKFEEG